MEKPEEQKSTSTTTSTTKSPAKPKPEAEEIFVRKKEVSTSGNPYKLATFLLAVLVFGLTAGVIYLEFFANRSPKKDPECSYECKEYIYVDHDDEENDIPMSSRDLIAEAKADRQVREIMQKLYDGLSEYGTEINKTANNDTYIIPIDKEFDTLAPYIYLDDHKTLIDLERSYDLKISTQDKNPLGTYTKLMDGGFNQKAQNILAANDFQEYYTISLATGYRNDKNGIICQTTGAGMPFIVTCGNENWINPESKKLSSELAEAYFNETGRNLHTINANPKEIQNSDYESYQRLETNTDGATQLFYRTSPEAKWQFFKSTQMILPCSDYNTDDLKRAFMGESCYIDSTVNANANTDTVKP